MINYLITSEVIEKIESLLLIETAFHRDDISFEIQDNYNHLLIYLSADRIYSKQSHAEFKRISDLIDKVVPCRKGDYTWTVIFKKDGKILDAYFGGDIDNPESGL